MRMKPKSTVHNTRALLYKRYTDLETSSALKALYITSDNKAWIFDVDSQGFLPYDGDRSLFGDNIINVVTNQEEFDVVTYRNIYFYYVMNFYNTKGGWVQSPTIPSQFDFQMAVTTIGQEANGIQDIPPEYYISLSEYIEIGYSGNPNFSATIEITNSFGETAIYQGNRSKEDGETDQVFEVPFINIREKGNKPNSVRYAFVVD